MATSHEAPQASERAGGFRVELDVFQGPFDLLLTLISRHRLDITEVALAEVTDEFLESMRQHPDLSRTTEFLVVAATLLSLKASRLLPHEEAQEDQDAEDLEARDLLFSHLLQYRAFKDASGWIARRLVDRAGAYPRVVPLEAHLQAALPELEWNVGADELARRAADALTHQPPRVQVAHMLETTVPVPEQARILADRLRREGPQEFGLLVADAGTAAVVVSRFLALLQLYRRGAVDLAQDEPLGTLLVTWSGGEGDVQIDDEFDAPGAPVAQEVGA